MIKLLIILVIVYILYFSIHQFDKFKILDEFYKLNTLIDIGDESKKFAFVENRIISSNLDNVSTASEGFKIVNQENKKSNIVSVITENVLLNKFTIIFDNDKLTLKKDNSIISNSSKFILDITEVGYYKFADDNDITINEEFIINIGTDNVIIDGNNVVINLVYSNNKNGVIKNGSSTINGHNNIIIKNIHFNYIYGETNMDSKLNENNSTEFGGGGVCCSYFAKGSKRNIIHNCYASKKLFSNHSGGIVGEYAGSNSGELIIMNCIFGGLLHYNKPTDNITYIGGICGAYLGYDNGKVFVYNCSNYGSNLDPGCGGIIGGYAAIKNSHVVVFGCSNLGTFLDMGNSGGIVGMNSCKDESNLSIICCYCINNKDLLTEKDEIFGGIVGGSSVLNKSNINIIMCYNNFIKYGEKTNYFIGDDSSKRDKDSKINIDYCFNSTLKDNISNNDFNKMEFKVNNPNISFTNSGKIYLEDTNSDLNNNTFLSNNLSSYYLNINKDDNSFPYNLIFMDHNSHKNTWNNFTKFVLWGTVAVIVVLVLMVIFLL